MAALKPGRSDELMPPHQQLEIYHSVRQHFDSVAPKRPLKPGRSEVLDSPFSHTAFTDPTPEFCKFQSLAAHSQPLIPDFSHAAPPEEFVETEYYDGLNSVDKSVHHTIGTGFIQIETNGQSNGVDSLNLRSSGLVRTKSQSNPATNDWIPAPDMVFPSSDKPARSDP